MAADYYTNDIVKGDSAAAVVDMMRAPGFLPRNLVLDSSSATGSAYLGGGATSSVYRVRDLKDGGIYAAKLLPYNDASSWDARILCQASKRLNGRGVVPKFRGSYIVAAGKWLVVVMELLAPLRYTSPGAAKYAAGMRRCLEEFHNAGFSHGDVHFDNFMVDPVTDEVRIVDFGLSYDYTRTEAAGFLPKVPRGKIFKGINWGWLHRHPHHDSENKQSDFIVDNVKLEALIDFLGV